MASAVASSFLVGDSRRAAGAPGASPGPAETGEAEYPARSTAAQMSSGPSCPSS